MKIFLWLTAILYPFIVFLSLDYVEPKLLAVVFLLLFSLRVLFFTKKESTFKKLLLIIPLSIFTWIVFKLNSSQSLLMYPVVISLMFLCIFALSLHFKPSVIERIARLHETDFPDEAIPYTNKVTMVWCLFFIFNASVAWYTAMFSSIEIWSFYNGFLSYVLMGGLFASEYLIRIFIIKK